MPTKDNGDVFDVHRVEYESGNKDLIQYIYFKQRGSGKRRFIGSTSRAHLSLKYFYDVRISRSAYNKLKEVLPNANH